MKNLGALLPALFLSVMPIQARTMFVATDGDNQAPGTQDQPYLTINHAVSIVQPGDTIFVRGGTYMLTEGIKIKAAQNAREDARIYLWAYNGEEVVIDGSGIPHTDAKSFKMARCIYHNHEANYWHYKGLTLCNAKDNGMKLEGSYNIVENCRFHDNNDTGLQLGMYKDFTYEETTSLPVGDPKFNPDYRFCRNNVIINCDSWNNDDKIQYNGTADDGGDADGFACKLFPGPGTEFHGCRAWNNSDDNWDLYMVYHPIVIETAGAIKAVTTVRVRLAATVTDSNWAVAVRRAVRRRGCKHRAGRFVAMDLAQSCRTESQCPFHRRTFALYRVGAGWCDPYVGFAEYEENDIAGLRPAGCCGYRTDAETDYGAFCE